MPTRRTRQLLVTAIALLAVPCLGAALILYLASSPSLACRRPAEGPARPGTSNRTLRSGGMQRCYRLHLPPDYDGTRPLPVVISLHGLVSNPLGQAYLSRWDDIADREGFAVVYPQGTGFPLRWNASAEFEISPVDDVQFLRDLIAQLQDVMAVDPARIYVNGMSNGGAMSHRLACEAAEVIAAVGIVSGPTVSVPGGCNPSRPIPVIAFYGTADDLVRYGGMAASSGHPSFLSRLLRLNARAVAFPSVTDWIEDWAARDGCDLVPETLPPVGDVSGIRYSDCAGGAEVILYTIEEGGHAWPGGGPTHVGKTSLDINASGTMWGFFEAHPLEP